MKGDAGGVMIIRWTVVREGWCQPAVRHRLHISHCADGGLHGQCFSDFTVWQHRLHFSRPIGLRQIPGEATTNVLAKFELGRPTETGAVLIELTT